MENNQQAYVLNSNDYSIREFNSTLSKTFTRMFTGLLDKTEVTASIVSRDRFRSGVILSNPKNMNEKGCIKWYN